jgi:hypothetical protein
MQLNLQFGRRVEMKSNGKLHDGQLENHVLTSSASFAFTGRGIPKENYRKGQFQYRFGRKVLPVDEVLC